MCERTAWRICRDNQRWSVFGKKRGKNGKHPGPPVHDDLVQRVFTADDAGGLWLTDITEHWTDEGKLYLCAIKDVFSGRIVGYSMSDRMKARLAVNALDNAGSRRGDVAGCIVCIRTEDPRADSTGRRNTLMSEVFEHGHKGLDQEDERRGRGASSAMAC